MDEIRETPWPGQTYRQGIELADQLGFNCINHVVVAFRPVQDTFLPGQNFEQAFDFFEWPTRPGYFIQYKAWSTQNPVHLQSTYGHEVMFDGRKVYPNPFVLKHYPIRSQAHGQRKILKERKPRFDPQERADGAHTHYDSFADTSSFIWRRDDLKPWNAQTRAEVLESARIHMSTHLSKEQAHER